MADLRAAADWFAMAEPDAAVRVSATVRGGGSLDAERLCEASARRGYGRLRVRRAAGAGRVLLDPVRPLDTGSTGVGEVVPLDCVAPERSPDSAAWLAEVLIDALRACGVRTPAEIVLRRAEG